MNYSLGDVWEELRNTRPLIYHLTNSVAVNFSANVTLAIGASPMMSLHPLEAGDFAQMAHGIVVNTGTPTEEGTKAMKSALEAIRGMDKPVLLDPVGYGVSPFRRELVHSFLKDYRVSIIKGNEGEMAYLGNGYAEFRGMDSLSSENPEKALVTIAERYRCLAVSTGKTDRLSDGKCLYKIEGGDRLLASVTAGGCALGSVICACVAACNDPMRGTIAGLAAMATASERAARDAFQPGSFAVAILDQLALIEPADLRDVSERLSVVEVGS